MIRRHDLLCLQLGMLLMAVASTSSANSTYGPMYFHSHVRDASACATSAVDGRVVFDDAVSNPAGTCPDAFGWKQFLDAVRANFWSQWANDETVWVADPKPLCSDSADTDCCFVAPGGKPQSGYRNAAGETVAPNDVGGPGTACPYIPGDWGGSQQTTFSGGKPQTSHNTTFLRNLDRARIARQREVEVVYRNDPFVTYTTANELYSKAGLARLFARVAGEGANSIPYRPTGQGVSYPPAAVMFKADWVPEASMLELGYVTDHDGNPATPPQDADHPWVTMKIKASTDDGKSYTEGLYYLAAITGASKALPRWHWYAFEHVQNLGRCDFLGCNDSYGFHTTLQIADPMDPDSTVTFASNFITPHTQDDQLRDSKQIFDLGKRYPGGDMSEGLAQLFTAMGIGSGEAPVNPNVPQLSDPAWQSYRLKGTQTTFYNTDGYATLMGASITEAGFVNSSSCMSCHVQASVNAQGGNGAPGVGASGRLNMDGYGEVVSGHPLNSDYYDRGTTRRRAVQTDFIWGVLFAQ